MKGGLEIGDSIGRYVVERELGAGGMGVVYQARDEDLDRSVALKVLPTALVESEERRVRFLREARAAAAVSHRNIAMVHEVGEDDGRVFIAMELVRGETLAERMARDGLSTANALLIALEIARGVAKAHDARVVHRDLKPSNVMLDEDGGVKILDFGLAKRLDDLDDEADEISETVSAITEEGRVLGTPGYMAPEQAEGRALSTPADVFSIGAILYEMLTGIMAFGGRSTAQRIAATLKDEPVPPRERVPELPVGYEALTLECLCKDPAERPEDAGALVARLAELTEDMSNAPRITIRPPSGGRVDAASVARGATELAAPKKPPKWWPAFVALPLLGLLGYWWTGRTSEVAGPPPPSFVDFVAQPQTLLGCPVWTVEGTKGPPGRLGAAAATQACADWGLISGRTDKRTPAMLLNLPVLPVDDFPAHPYVAPNAREKSLARAKELALALDGHVVVKERSFEVRVELLRGGKAAASSTKEHRVLEVAVHDAVRDIAKAMGIDEARPLPGGVAELTSCKDVRCFLDRNVIDQDVLGGHDVASSCKALAEVDAVLAGARASECGHTGRTAEGLPVWPPNLKAAIDALPEVGRSFWWGLLRLHSLKPEEAKKEAERVRRLREAAKEEAAVVLFAILEAVLVFRAGDQDGVGPLLDRAWELAPTNCTARTLAYELALGDSRRYLARAATGWCPSVPHAWRYQYAAEEGDDRDIELKRTAYYLRAGALEAGVSFTYTLITRGKPQQARLIASRYLGGSEAERLAGAYLKARVDIAEGRIGSGLAQLDKLLKQQKLFGRRDLHQADWGGVGLGLEAGELVGRASTFADQFLERFLLAEDFAVESSSPLPHVYAASFATPEVAKRAIVRVRELMKSGKLWLIDEIEPWLESIRLHHAGDAKAAAEALRPLVANATFRNYLRPEIFDAAGEPSLASELDQHGISISGAFVLMSFAREARRAEARGDLETARSHAKRFVDAWATADVKVPLVDEMRAILER